MSRRPTALEAHNTALRLVPTGKLDAADRAPRPTYMPESAEVWSRDPAERADQFHALLDRLGVKKGRR